MPRHLATPVPHLHPRRRVGVEVGPVVAVGDVEHGDAEGAEAERRQGGVVEEVEGGGGDDEDEEDDEEDDAEGAAAYAAEAPAALWFRLEGGWEDGLSLRPMRRFEVGVSVGGGFLYHWSGLRLGVSMTGGFG